MPVGLPFDLGIGRHNNNANVLVAVAGPPAGADAMVKERVHARSAFFSCYNL